MKQFSIKITLFFCVLIPFGSPSQTCKTAVSHSDSKSPASAQSENQARENFLLHTNPRIVTRINQEQLRKDFRENRNVLYVSTNHEINENSTFEAVQALLLQTNSTAISIVIIPRSTSLDQMVNPSVRAVNWQIIEDPLKNQHFASHLERAFSSQKPTIFILPEKDFNQILSSLESSAYSALIDNTGSIYIPSIHALRLTSNSSKFFNSLHSSTTVFGTTKPKVKPQNLTPKQTNQGRRDSIVWNWRNKNQLQPAPPKAYRSYRSAMDINRLYNIASISEYKKIQEERPDLNLPPDPETTYSKYWKSWKAFLAKKPIYTYTEAVQVLQENNITNFDQYEFLRTSGDLPKDLPKYPRSYYQNQYEGAKKFFSIEEFSYRKAQLLVQAVPIRTEQHYIEARRDGTLPPDLPFNPAEKYDEWEGWGAFLRKKPNTE